MKPYIHTAIIGNGRMLATLDAKGEIHRVFWPSVDIAQQVDLMFAAIFSPALGAKAVSIHDEQYWLYSQEYMGDTCILKTEARAKDGTLQIQTFDYVVPGKDVLVRRFEVGNISNNPLPARFLYFSSMNLDDSAQYNAACFDNSAGVLMHYRRGTWFAIAGQQKPDDFSCGCSIDDAFYCYLNENNLAMSTNGCQAWDLGIIEPGQTKHMVVYFCLGNNREQVLENVSKVRSCGWENLMQETAAFWETYLLQGYSLPDANEEIKKIFKRSVMVCKLLMNDDTGGIIAAPEFDEFYKLSGGYGYCWGRDASMIANAMLKAGYTDYAKKYYQYAAKNQNPRGDWPQRQYTNGELAPGWGDQIDQTGTILWGIYQHYRQTWDINFIEEMWNSIVLAADFLVDWLNDRNSLPQMSYDLWEERFGQHAYSFAAVYAGLKAAGLAAKEVGMNEKALQWLEASITLKKRIMDSFWDADLNRFVRSHRLVIDRGEYERRKEAGEQVDEQTEPSGKVRYEAVRDAHADVSLLGLVIPFGVIPATDDKMQETAKHLIGALMDQETGGVKRYFNDGYIGGNPWAIAKLWLGLFQGAAGNWEEAVRALQWAVNHKTSLDFLPEQVDRNTGGTAWVVPLAWSHAMFILLATTISEAGKF